MSPGETCAPHLVLRSEDDEKDRAGGCGDADPRMKEKTDGDVEGHPGEIEKSSWSGTGEKLTNLVEIADRLQPVPAPSRYQRQAQDGVIGAPDQVFIDRTANAEQDAAAKGVQS